MPMYTCTYSPDDNKLRLSADDKLDAATYARVKGAGFAWAPKQQQFIAPMWSPEREDLALELAGEIDDDDTTLLERAEARRERCAEYHDKRSADAGQAHAAVERLTEGMPLGQPILVGHHSEKRARRDAERIENGIRKAVDLWETAQYWQARAAAALRHARYVEAPDVRARRIKRLEADLRKQQKNQNDMLRQQQLYNRAGLTLEQGRHVANFCPFIVCEDADGVCQWSAWDVLRPDDDRYARCPSWTVEQVVTRVNEILAERLPYYARWIAHLEHRLTYERAMLGSQGGTVADQNTPEKGGACQCWVGRLRQEWFYIQKVNKVSVSLLDNWGNGGKNFTRTIPCDKLTRVMSAADVERHRDAGRLTKNAYGTGFVLLEPPPERLAPVAGRETLTQSARGLSSGTMSSLTGESAYTRLDAIREAFGVWCETQPDQQQSWLEAWPAFWLIYTAPAPVPTLTPEVVTTLKETLHAGVQVTALICLTTPRAVSPPQEETPAPTLATLHAQLQATVAHETGQRTCEKLARTLTAKLAPRKAQAAPGGLFAQEQLSLYSHARDTGPVGRLAREGDHHEDTEHAPEKPAGSEQS